MAITISCSADISNLFTRAQHNLSKQFDNIEGFTGIWDGMIPNGGSFPVGSGFAARVTTLAQQRLGFSTLNDWTDMVGLQSDCTVSCDPPTETLNFGNADHDWYRLQFRAFNTKPYCLESMFADALNLQESIRQIFTNLKMVTADVLDEFARRNHSALAKYRWMGYDDGTNQSLLKNQWRFATDANGNIDDRYIILDPTVNPNNLALLSVSGILNRIRNFGQYTKTFPVDGEIPLVTDYETFSELALYDTNVRADNRFRSPGVLDPSYAGTTSYAGYKLKNDPFQLRYYWTTTEPGYPNGVLKRISPWTDQQMSEGCFSDASLDYQLAPVAISYPWGGSAFKMQNGEQPLSAGSGVDFKADASPWNGVWRWVNEINEITPCNVDRNKGFWRAVFKKAARPVDAGYRGHAILYRRFPQRGITRVCAALNSPAGGSTDCTNTCPPLDWYPPSLVDRFECGQYNASGTCS